MGDQNGTSPSLKYTKYQSIDHLRLALAHLDSASGDEKATYTATFRISQHDIVLPPLKEESKAIVTLSVVCPHCGREVSLAGSGFQAYCVQARDEKAQALTRLSKKIRKETVFFGGFVGVFPGLMLWLGIDLHPLLAFASIPIGAALGTLPPLFKFRSYMRRNARLIVFAGKVRSQTQEMDAGPFTVIPELSLKNGGAFSAGGHRIAFDAVPGEYTDVGSNTTTTLYTDVSLASELTWCTRYFDENATVVQSLGSGDTFGT